MNRPDPWCPNPIRSRRGCARLAVESLEERTAPAGNPIVAENQLPGTPQSTWAVSGAGDSTIQGFTTDISVDQGQTVSFKINDAANKPYYIDIYRMGYYQGNGARLITTIPSSQTLRQVQPNPLKNTATGLVDAGNWAVSASWTVPTTAVSGLYFARVAREDTGGASLIWFVVRDDDGASDLLFQTSDSTWQAYNQWGGNSLYLGTGPGGGGRAYKVSYNRPLVLDGSADGYNDYNSPLHAEYPMIRWLEANGYNVSYSTDVDSDRRGAEIREHKVFLSVGHDEYWSGAQRANVEAARDAGVNLAFFSGNECFWKTRWENSIDSSGTSYRTLVCYKESKDGARTDPLDISQGIWTGTWRDNRFSPPADGGRPENALSGVLYMNDRTSTDLGVPMTVSEADGKLRFWRNTSVATLNPGQTATLGQYIVGYETDEDLDNGFRPAGLITMSSTSFSTNEHVVVPWGTQVGPGTSTHKITLYRAASGALVFGAGTVQWSWGLDGTHNDTPTTPSTPMRQATVNLFADMGVQPGSLQPGLVAATMSADTVAPSSTITSPTAGSVVQAGSAVTMSGTAADSSGRVGGVEVSTDGGTNWHPAVGRTSWSYTWVPGAAGTAVLKSRAVDDSGNRETPSAGVSVTVSTSNTLVAAYSFDEGTGSTLGDATGKGNNGTISGPTWSAAGKYGGALSFDGVNDWVTVNDSNSLDLANALTLEAWVNPTAINGWECALMKEATGDLAYAIYADNNGNDSGGPRRPVASIRQGNSTYWTPGTAQLSTNTWTHLAVTYDGSNLNIYVNGSLASSLPRSGPINVSSSPLRMGGNSLWGEWFNGLIDEVRIYSRALGQAEIQTDMNTRVNSDSQPPTAPGNLSATGGVGSVALTWTAATDNVGVVNYNVHRSTTANFTPSASNRVAQPTGTSYTDTGLAAGTYYYKVTAQDAAGNISAPSNQASGMATADTTAPTVSITAPSDGSTVNSTVTVSANASDNVGVTGVQFLLDGANLGAEDTSAPYSVSWDTTAAANGSHTLTARARDAAGNQTTSAAISVTVSNQPATGLVAAYGFNEGNGATVADASGSGNAGTTSNTTWAAAGKYGKALSFNGTSSWVTVNDSASLDLTSSLTLEAWVNPTAINGWECLLLKEATGDLAYALYGDDNGEDTGGPRQPIVSVRQGSTTSWTPGAAQLSLNTWSHLAATYDGTDLKMYVNGSLGSSRALTGAINVSNGVLRIGGNSIWGEWFNGLIDEVRIYNRALTPTQVQTDMNTAIGAADTQPPTAPTNLAATGGVGSVALTWTAATDNVGVANYNVHRSTTSGFTPSAANRVAQPTATSYTDAGLAAGTFYYKVTAQDAAGNVGPASNEASGTATADTTAPAVSITAPTNGATVNGVVTVSANASDNVGVAGVQFLLDGANLGAEDTTAPYSVSWDTTAAANGSHSLTARARDAAGNQTTSAVVNVSVSNQPATGLVAAYGFNEGAGSTVTDSSGNGLTGTTANTSWSASGKYGNALSFNGINSWVTVNDTAALDLTTGLTLEAWVNPIAIVNWRTVMLKEAGTQEVYALYANDDMPRPEAAVRIGGAYKLALGSSPVAINAWTHLASTYDGSNLRLYVNGTQVGSIAATGNIEVSTGVLRIGGNAIWGEYFSGLIDEVRVYNRALTQAQIQSDMNTPVGSPERLMAEPGATGEAAPLSPLEIRPIFDEAVSRWSAAIGPAVERLRTVRTEVLDLPDTTLGLASGNVIFLDVNGAEHGWFMDPTPWDDSEFVPGLADSPTVGQVDLLTVITHEMGHILGLDDDSATDSVAGSVMADVLPLGVRRIHLNGLVTEPALAPTGTAIPAAAPDIGDMARTLVTTDLPFSGEWFALIINPTANCRVTSSSTGTGLFRPSGGPVSVQRDDETPTSDWHPAALSLSDLPGRSQALIALEPQFLNEWLVPAKAPFED
jgi:N,N-dimethylformamidase beta subunit-like, C-terminal/Concanavalin A-like lectin/glucanases superfamily/Bacterial Ig domain